jgi:undecaprenyl pyrophosphate phosphatase UppP
MVLLGTIPVVIGGRLLHDVVETTLRSPLVIATTTVVFGLVIAMAGVYEVSTRIEQAAPVDWRELLTGVVVSGISAWICILFFMRLIERTGMWPFVAYRSLPGAFLFLLFL